MISGRQFTEGHRKKKWGKSGGAKRTRDNVWVQDGSTKAGWTEVRQNDQFDLYYKRQKIVSDGEWDCFHQFLQRDLPATFRIVEGTMHTDCIKAHVEAAMSQSSGLIRRLDWYPGLAFEVKASRAQLRFSPELSDFHKFLVKQSEAGTIFRQEAVSMVPALFLNVEPGCRVLDMCASPGSKTSQIIEKLHRPLPDAPAGDVPRGVVVANDACSKRGHMLIHHLRHLRSPCLVVTNHFAQLYPNVLVESDEAESSSAACSTNDSSGNPCDVPLSCRSPLRFHSVLCDVPCSGDGTMRKSKILWKDWTSARGVGLHKLQLHILRRGLELCEVGGRVVYSTCSLNPMENEAVVNAALQLGGPAVTLLDVAKELPSSLKRRPGLETWSVHYKGEWLDVYDGAALRQRKQRERIFPTMFPQFRSSPEEGPSLSLCMRFLPHLSDTGGFFVAVLQKIAPMAWGTVETVDESGTAVPADEINIPDAGGCDDGDAEVTIVAGEEPTVSLADEGGEGAPSSRVAPDCRSGGADEAETTKGEHYSKKVSRADPSSSWFKGQTDFVCLNEIAKFKIGKWKQAEDFWHFLGHQFGLLTPTKREFRSFFVKYESVGDPKRAWFTSSEAARILHGVGRSALKVVNAGTLAFEGRGSPYYRLTGSGSAWLLKSGWGEGFSERAKNRILKVSPASLLYLLSIKVSPLTSDTEKVTLSPDSDCHSTDVVGVITGSEAEDSPGSAGSGELSGGLHIAATVDVTVPTANIGVCKDYRHKVEAMEPLLRDAVLALDSGAPCLCVAPAGGGLVAVPGWRGKTNIEMLVDAGTRHVLQGLLASEVGKLPGGAAGKV